MKKYLLLLICCVMLALTGCESRKLVGTWNVTYYVTAGQETTLEALQMDDSSVVEYTLVFNEDGTGTIGEYLPFTWVKDGKTVTITQTYLDRTEVTIFELDGKELKFYEDPADLTSYTVYTKRDLVIEETTAE